MPIENRALTPGTTLVAKYKKETRTCDVVEEGGEARFKLPGDDKLYKSPSAAASAVMGGIAANGWKFWSIEGEAAPVGETPPRATKPATSHPKPTMIRRLIRKTPNQRGVPEGSTKWFCSSCMKSFVAATTPEPSACPEGHPAQAADEPGSIE